MRRRFAGLIAPNWELSAERANATRRLLAEAGLPEARVQTVSGRADRDPLFRPSRYQRPTAASPLSSCGNCGRKTGG